MPFDFKKEYKEFYLPKNEPEIVTVPRANYIAVRGTGDPNEENGAYQRAIGVLYAVAYTLKMSRRAGYEIDGAVNIYAGCYNNPFLIWGKYRKKWLRTTLPVSFQFHHTQMDGIPAAEFLERLQQEIRH